MNCLLRSAGSVLWSSARSSVCSIAFALVSIFLGLCLPCGHATTLAQDASGASSSTPKPVRCLIVTGEDYPGHKWQETAPVLKKALEAGGKIQVDVAEDSRVLASDSPQRYDVIVIHFKNYNPEVPGRAALENLQQLVKQGKGLVLVHFACGAFQEFKEDFAKLAGRVWDPNLRGHDPYGKFTVRIVAQDHPITRGLKDFETQDELYTCLTGDVPIQVLAVARSKVDGKDYPMAFVLEVGKGRVFHCLLGHDVAAFQAEGVQELYRRGCLWVARGL